MSRADTPTRRAFLVWGAAMLAYVVGVFHRSSLGVAGVAAEHRFGIGAAALATLSVAQVAVYALMQVPAGVLLDRFGSRRLLATGAVLMGGGQLLFAVASDVRVAVAARVLVGLGDALSFLSVIRLVALWFPPRRNALMVQLSGVLGQLGSIASAVPLVLLLGHAGWTPTFLGAAGLGVVVLAMVALAVRDPEPVRDRRAAPLSLSAVRRDLRASWAEPGTRLGFWAHFVTQFSGMVFLLLWGYPFLVEGEGLSPATAALLLSALTLAAIAAGPLVGYFCGWRPFRRSALVLGIAGLSALAWTAVLAWPGRAPLWLLVVLVLVLAVNGPGSMIGFDYARSFNPPGRLGNATGIVNVGGYTATIALIIGIGVTLDAVTPGSATSQYPLSSFRWALSLQYLLWALGAVQVVRYRNRARQAMAERDPAGYAAMRRIRPPRGRCPGVAWRRQGTGPARADQRATGRLARHRRPGAGAEPPMPARRISRW